MTQTNTLCPITGTHSQHFRREPAMSLSGMTHTPQRGCYVIEKPQWNKTFQAPSGNIFFFLGGVGL